MLLYYSSIDTLKMSFGENYKRKLHERIICSMNDLIFSFMNDGLSPEDVSAIMKNTYTRQVLSRDRFVCVFKEKHGGRYEYLYNKNYKLLEYSFIDKNKKTVVWSRISEENRILKSLYYDLRCLYTKKETDEILLGSMPAIIKRRINNSKWFKSDDIKLLKTK